MIHQNNPRTLEDSFVQNTNSQIPHGFRRILQCVAKNDGTDRSYNNKPMEMSMKVTTRPNPFFTSVTLDVTCDQNKHIIVRMFDEAGKIIKMLSWYVMKGSNVTSINELNILSNGQYFLDIIDTEGTVLFNTMLSKQ